jgi:hypothetical protein
MKKLIFVLFVSFTYLNISSQQLISTSGDYFKTKDYTISWSIGEIVTDYSERVTQGMQQPLIERDVNIKTVEQKVKVYPNPVKGILTIETKNRFSITDIEGTIIYSGKENKVNMSDNKSGIYILKVNNSVIKIIKL